jgi:hypothetical protein
MFEDLAKFQILIQNSPGGNAENQENLSQDGPSLIIISNLGPPEQEAQQHLTNNTATQVSCMGFVWGRCHRLKESPECQAARNTFQQKAQGTSLQIRTIHDKELCAVGTVKRRRCDSLAVWLGRGKQEMNTELLWETSLETYRRISDILEENILFQYESTERG